MLTWAITTGFIFLSVDAKAAMSEEEAIPSLPTFTAPAIPRGAKDKRIVGKAVVEIKIGKDGLVSAKRILTGHPLFSHASAEAVKNRRFKPSKQEHSMQITFCCELTQDECEGMDKQPVKSETHVSAELPNLVFIRTSLPCAEIKNSGGKH